MLNGLLYKWFHPHRVAGLVVQLGVTTGEYGFGWMVLEQKKGKALVTGKGETIGDVGELKNVLPEGVPVSLSITGKGVLVRKVPQAKTEQPDTLVQELLPGAKASDYYWDVTEASLGQAMVAMVRKSVVDALISGMHAQGIAVLNLHIGPLAAGQISSLVEYGSQEKQLDLPGYSIKFNHDNVPEQIERIEPTEAKIYSVAGERLAAKEVLPFATALGFWLAPYDDFFGQEATGKIYEEHLHKSLFNKGLKGVLGVFFVALLLNFVLFDQQYRQNAELVQLTGNKQERLQQFEALKKEYDQNLAFLSVEGWLNPAKASFYADGLSATVPQEVVLTQMVVYPDTAARKTSNTRSRFDTKSILLAGQVNSSSLLQEWAVQLRQIPWINSVTVKNYSQENPKAKGMFDVIVEIKP